MFGSVENFEGLAVVIDTFDNNGLVRVKPFLQSEFSQMLEYHM